MNLILHRQIPYEFKSHWLIHPVLQRSAPACDLRCPIAVGSEVRLISSWGSQTMANAGNIRKPWGTNPKMIQNDI